MRDGRLSKSIQCGMVQNIEIWLLEIDLKLLGAINKRLGRLVKKRDKFHQFDLPAFLSLCGMAFVSAYSIYLFQRQNSVSHPKAYKNLPSSPPGPPPPPPPWLFMYIFSANFAAEFTASCFEAEGS